MSEVSHQTIKLSKGKHSSARNGACVMELASMLAEEQFGDHPAAVSRPLAAFMRGYNDLIDDNRRQDLYAFASKSVGTATSAEVEDARADMLIAWGDRLWERRSPGRLLLRLRRPRVKRERLRDPEAAGSYAVHAITKVSDEIHAAALALMEQLIAMQGKGEQQAVGEPGGKAPIPEAVAGSPT